MRDKIDQPKLEQRLIIAFILNSLFMVFELMAGILSGSLALIADAGHNLTDSVSMLISFVANRLAQRPANERKTFGYGRIKIVAATANAFILVGVAAYVFHEAYLRFLHPSGISGWVVIVVSLIGIVINGSIALSFRTYNKDLNMQSLFVNMYLDTLALLGAMVAGILVLWTGLTIFDPLIGVVVGIMLLVSAWRIIWDALHVILEGVPAWIDYNKVESAIMQIDQIKSFHDLHIWAISSEEVALSVHVQLANYEIKKGATIIQELKNLLRDKFQITHTTIETETTKNSPDPSCPKII